MFMDRSFRYHLIRGCNNLFGLIILVIGYKPNEHEIDIFMDSATQSIITIKYQLGRENFVRGRLSVE